MNFLVCIFFPSRISAQLFSMPAHVLDGLTRNCPFSLVALLCAVSLWEQIWLVFILSICWLLTLTCSLWGMFYSPTKPLSTTPSWGTLGRVSFTHKSAFGCWASWVSHALSIGHVSPPALPRALSLGLQELPEAKQKTIPLSPH